MTSDGDAAYVIEPKSHNKTYNTYFGQISASAAWSEQEESLLFVLKNTPVRSEQETYEQ